MSESGPTTVGSIVGKLRMDRDQWVAMMAATKADIRDLEASDPDIHVDTNAAEVTAKLGAAKAAADALGGAQDELGRKTRSTTDATIKANEANRTSVTRVGAIATAVALLLPLLTPVGAAAIGIGSAFLGMGAAGILAIIGIRNEMQAGTAVGNSYRDGLNSLKGSMNQLGQTSALAMLTSFRRVVAETRDAMPQLNTQVGQFSSLLGRSGANLFTGTINSLRVLNPLFLTAGVYIRELTEGFQAWTESGGIEEFGGYALATLPMVTEVLGKLATMVMHILEALAPLGTIGMATLVGISNVITAIPVEILSQLIVTLTWGAIAFKAWGFVAPMLASIATSMGAVGAATTIATGPIGWVVAGLAALAGIFAVVIAQNTGATQAMQDYTAAVDADTGAIGENIRMKAAQKLLDAGAIDSAKKLGISGKLVLDATLGVAGAQKELNAALEIGTNGSKRQKDQLARTGLGLVDYGLAVQTVKQGVEGNSAAIIGELGRYRTLHDTLEETTAATRAQQAADEAAAGALGISVGALQEAQAGQEGVESATAKATAEMYIQGDAAGLLKQALDALNGKAISAAEAQNQFESQLVRMPDYIDEATGAFDEAGASLDGMSESAITNRGSLLDLIQSAQNSAQAYRDQGASSEEARQKLIDAKQAIEDQAVANGMNRDSVKAYLDQLFQIPESVPKTKIEVDTATATAQTQNFLSWVSSRVATIQVRATLPDLNGAVSGSGRPGLAMGGTVRGLAGGGSGGTVWGGGTAGSDSAGIYRLGHGEEVISNVFGQASRNRSLLKQINAGYTPAATDAGITRSTGSASPSAMNSPGTAVQVDVHVTGTQQSDPRVLGEITGTRIRRALTGVTK